MIFLKESKMDHDRFGATMRRAGCFHLSVFLQKRVASFYNELLI